MLLVLLESLAITMPDYVYLGHCRYSVKPFTHQCSNVINIWAIVIMQMSAAKKRPNAQLNARDLWTVGNRTVLPMVGVPFAKRPNRLCVIISPHALHINFSSDLQLWIALLMWVNLCGSPYMCESPYMWLMQISLLYATDFSFLKRWPLFNVTF